MRPYADRSRDGFTLIELLIVVSIIGLLIAILIPTLGGASDAAKRSSTNQLMRQIITAGDQFQVAERRYPGKFKARDMGSVDNRVARGFTEMENALLDLNGGWIADELPVGEDADDWLLDLGPFPTGDDRNVLVKPAEVQGSDAGYLRLDGDTLTPVIGQACETDVYETNGLLDLGMPDILDPWGQPLLLWRRDIGAPEAINLVQDFARVDSSDTRASFYWASNRGYLDAGPHINRDTARSFGLGRGDVDQATFSYLGGHLAQNPTLIEANLAAALGHPDFPVEDNLSLPASPRGRFILMSAADDEVYLNKFKAKASRADIEDFSGSHNRLGFGPEGFPPANNSPEAGAPGAVVSQLDDLVQATGS